MLEELMRVSIHATLAGGDREFPQQSKRRMGFYPRHPRGWRRLDHAPVVMRILRFYPRHPRGWRRLLQILKGDNAMFLSTPPSRVATLCCRRLCKRHQGFYPRHPRGWRRKESGTPQAGQCFYPRHPRGWRPRELQSRVVKEKFLSTPPSRVATYNS